METLFDVIGVALIIWGSIHIVVGIIQAAVVGLGLKGAGFRSGGSAGAAIIILIISSGWGAFLLWAGFQVVGIQQV